MSSIRVIREEAEQEEQQPADPILQQLSRLVQTQTLLNEMKGVELSIPVESMSRVLQNYHGKFEANIKNVSQKQQNIIKQLKTLELDESMGRPDGETNKIFKKMEQFQEIRHETEKYKVLVGMMKTSLIKLEEGVDEMIDKRIAQIKQNSK